MNPQRLFPILFLIGGAPLLADTDLQSDGALINHTLAGEKIPSKQVVCRNCWGTPMLPDGKGSYNELAPIKKGLILQSLWIPPVSGTRPIVQAPPVPGSTAPIAPTSVVTPSK